MRQLDFQEELCNLHTLNTGWLKVLGNGGVAGGDGVSLTQFQKSLKVNLAQIASQIDAGSFEHGPYRQFDIPKRGGKIRRLMVPCIADRVVHTTIAQVLTPILEPHFEDSGSCGIRSRCQDYPRHFALVS